MRQRRRRRRSRRTLAIGSVEAPEHEAFGGGTASHGFVGRFLGSWRLALGELVIVALGVLIALWADQAVQARQDRAREISYLERLRSDVQADLAAFEFSREQERNRLATTRRVDAWVSGAQEVPDADALVVNTHYAGVTFSPTISRFTIEEMKSTGDLLLLENAELKQRIASYYNQVDLQVGRWIGWAHDGITETYFRELAFVVDPEHRIRIGEFDPQQLQLLLRSGSGGSGDGGGPSLEEVQRTAPAIGATAAEAEQMLDRMRSRPNFQGYLRDSMYWAQLSSQLLGGVITSATELDEAIARELDRLR